ncbi:glycoside hydrolase family 108 protein [Ancylobacter sp. SL191]|uniref:glycoside hydrolase family 108 protein n=1 Tax=Ancylobacter sp. SL191 TaxID=2995166 RepID=UPI00226F3C02|nr:glycoside hydrolase family 108 protein [Ancylobacter sp. SL191]WAC26354.1 glycoside hydrolase family 108 protein [Ancylobacter sp. SL191]
MAKTEFKEALRRVLVHEGGYVDHPADPGGATNKGVTQRVYDGWRRRQGLALRSVAKITPAEVEAIYRFQYWDQIKGDAMPEGVAYVVFDGAVHSGPEQSGKWLQRSLGALYTGKIDGHVGDATLDALELHPDHDKLIADILARRLAMLQGLKTWRIFGKGWSRRVAEVLAHGQAAARGSVGPEPTYTREGAAHASLDDVATAPAPIGGSAGAVAGGSGTAVVIDQAKETLQPMLGSHPWVDQVFAALVVAGVVVAVGGTGYAIWAAHRNKKVAAIQSGEAKADLTSLPALVPA